MELNASLPSLQIQINNQQHMALVDTGCSQSLISKHLVGGVTGDTTLLAVDGRLIHNIGEREVEMMVQGRRIKLKCLIMNELLPGYKVILGMDVIRLLGGITIGCDEISFLNSAAVALSDPRLHIQDKDFDACFNGEDWEVSWKWHGESPILLNRTSMYNMSPNVEERFDDEIKKWIDKGWLVPCSPPQQGIIPMMAVVQETKGKVRPVLDFRELNKFVKSHTGDSDVCDETIRKWRMMRGKLGILDLSNAYLQIRINKDLRNYQTVSFKGEYYTLTRLGFGLSCAPRIMSTILRQVLSLDPRIQGVTDHYIDDIVVNEDVASVAEVSAHLAKYGLQTKPPEDFGTSRILGLQLYGDRKGDLRWKRGNAIPSINEQGTSRRELFSVCGKLVGHYPIAGWLRIACSYIKRCSDGRAWEDDVGDLACERMKEVLRKLDNHDPVQGLWSVDNDGVGMVWTDASSLALGAVVEVGCRVVEDASWLRKKDDNSHINVAELEATIKGLNAALKWGLKKITILTDSATVFGWLQSLLSGSNRVRVSGLSEMLVRRRLFLVGEMRDEFGLDLSVQLVRSAENKADALTRVPKTWLQRNSSCSGKVKEWHDQHHFGVDRTLFLARQISPSVTRKEVEGVVRSCQQCKSVDPAPVPWESGGLDVDSNWQRLAVDVTHFEREKYLTMVDCGPSRFAIWRRITSEEASVICSELQQIFRERGPPTELLLDNSATFR